MGVVITENRIVPAWLAAVAHLERNGGRYRNMVIEIDTPDLLTATDRRVIGAVDEALGWSGKTTVLSVAGTIFPQGLYKRAGADGMSEHFLQVMRKGKKPGTWGTYAMRLMARPGRTPDEVINPLQLLIEKMKHAAGPGRAFASNYELGVHDPADLAEPDLEFCDVPLYSPCQDGGMVRNQPCLSHLSFKLANKSTLELTAIYRSHYYAERALGNFIGLRHLMNYVAAGAGVQAGRLTCISTDAQLDLAESWGGAARGRTALARVIEASTSVPATLESASAQSSETCIPA